MDPKKLNKKVEDLMEKAEKSGKFLKGLKKESCAIVSPAWKAYLDKSSELHEEFGRLLYQHAIHVFGCDEACVNSCLNQTYIAY